jgi:hypothetical protein
VSALESKINFDDFNLANSENETVDSFIIVEPDSPVSS